jgi:GGDEF domain-containing protein
VTSEEIGILQDLARLVVDELELRKIATVDALTGALTKRAFLAEGDREIWR